MQALQSAQPDLINYCMTNLGLHALDQDYSGCTAQEQANFYCAGEHGRRIAEMLATTLNSPLNIPEQE